ncbi:MAG: hypothetical protein ACP5EN_16135 [Rhodovulum sp.]
MATGGTTRHWMRAAALALALMLPGCVVLDTVQQDVSFGKAEDCEISRFEGSGVIGAYLRQVEGTPAFALIYVEGRQRRNGMPRDISLGTDTVPWWAPSARGQRTILHRSSATPLAGFGPGDAMPGVFDFAYRSDGVDYGGPIVVGRSPRGTDLPTTGNSRFTGRAELSLARPDGATTTAQGRFEATIGYGGGQSAFLLSGMTVTEGPPLPFTALTWTGLGQCGARIVSSGKGSVRVQTAEGRATTPFARGREVPEIRSAFESALFGAKGEAGPPARFGGAFLIEGDAGTLSGVFLSTGGG